MSKLDILAEGREQGILLARKVVEAAQKDGRDPLKAIDDELAYRKRFGQQSKLTRKEIQEAFPSFREETKCTLMGVAGIVLWDRFGFGGNKRLPLFFEECEVYLNALANGSVTWADIDGILKDKCGILIVPEKEEN